jgi:malonyl-CoA O-methyltransferase
MPSGVFWMSDRDRYALDARDVRRSFEEAALRYDGVALLQRRVRESMLERLELVKVTPRTVLDAGAGTGHAAAALARRYSGARVIAMDLAPAMLEQARRRAAWFRKQGFVCADLQRAPLADGSVDLLFSSLALQWCSDLDAVFAEFHRILAADGVLTFSTFGPDTLQELRDAWRQADDFSHVNAFLDMHDIGDALVRAGFQGAALDVERFTLTYPDVYGLMRDLKAMGAHNVTAGRRPALTGKGRIAAMTRTYEARRNDAGQIPASYEVVYGHAWAPQTRGHASDDGFRIPVSAVRRTLR